MTSDTDPADDYRIVDLVQHYEKYTNSNLPMCDGRGNMTGAMGHGNKKRATKEIQRRSTGSILARSCESCVPAFLDTYGFKDRSSA